MNERRYTPRGRNGVIRLTPNQRRNVGFSPRESIFSDPRGLKPTLRPALHWPSRCASKALFDLDSRRLIASVVIRGDFQVGLPVEMCGGNGLADDHPQHGSEQ